LSKLCNVDPESSAGQSHGATSNSERYRTKSPHGLDGCGHERSRGGSASQDATQGVGDPTEGTIVIADPSKLGSLVAGIRDTVANASARGRPEDRAVSVRKSTSSHETQCGPTFS
jgi:hypothetical protein